MRKITFWELLENVHDGKIEDGTQIISKNMCYTYEKDKKQFISNVTCNWLMFSLRDFDAEIELIDTNEPVRATQRYWYINSDGQICWEIFSGNTEEDEWRKITNNIYTTKKKAMEAKCEILEKAKKDEEND